MRITSGTIATRLALAGGVVVGALAGTRHVTGRPLDALTSAACVARLPGTAARCDSDRFVAHTGPFIGPAIVGGLAGFAVALVVVVLVRALLRAVSGNGRPAVAPVGGTPAWVITPSRFVGGQRCPGCGRALDGEVVRFAGARCGDCSGRSVG